MIGLPCNSLFIFSLLLNFRKNLLVVLSGLDIFNAEMSDEEIQQAANSI